MEVTLTHEFNDMCAREDDAVGLFTLFFNMEKSKDAGEVIVQKFDDIHDMTDHAGDEFDDSTVWI